MLSSQIKNQIAIYKEEIEKLEKQLSIIGPIKRGDICHIETGISYCVAKKGNKIAISPKVAAKLKQVWEQS